MPLLIKDKVILIATIFVAITLTISGFSYLQFNILDSVRAYIRGESLWAKAQKDALFHLQAFAYTKDNAEYVKFLELLATPLGDKQARQALQADTLDYSLAYQGLIKGQNHPEDIDSMINFFLRFQHISYMKDAIVAWTEADMLLEELMLLASTMHDEVSKDAAVDLSKYTPQLTTLNEQITAKEYEFSYVLSQGAMWMKHLSYTIWGVVLLIMIALAIAVTRPLIFRISKTERDLLISENYFKSLFDTNLIGIINWDESGAITRANKSFLTMLGYDDIDVETGKLNWQSLTPDKWKQQDRECLAEVLQNGYCKPFEKEYFNKQGKAVPTIVGAALLNGEANNGIAFVLDLTESREAQKELLLSATVFDSTSNSIFITNSLWNIESVNNTYLQRTHYQKEDLIGCKPYIFSELMDQYSSRQLLDKVIENKGYLRTRLSDRTLDGEKYPVEVSISAVTDEHGCLINYVILMTDITEQLATEHKLEQLAHYDYLTGLVSRSLFIERHEQAVLRAQRSNTRFATLFIDLDKFKPINDNLGHEVGDKILTEVANRLQSQVRANDTVGRFGGDEFVVLLEDIKEANYALKVADKISSSLIQTTIVGEHVLSVGCSIGISIFPDDSTSSKELIKFADHAMYQSKQNNRNSCCFYHEPIT